MKQHFRLMDDPVEKNVTQILQIDRLYRLMLSSVHLFGVYDFKCPPLTTFLYILKKEMTIKVEKQFDKEISPMSLLIQKPN